MKYIDDTKFDITKVPRWAAPGGAEMTDAKLDALLGELRDALRRQASLHDACIDSITALCQERDDARADAKVWRHIAQEQCRARDPNERDYAIEGALDALFNGYRKTGK
jgi:hypothetical protein